MIEKSAPVNDVVLDINANLDAAVDALEGLLVKKAGLAEAVGLIDGLYPGAAAEGLRNFPDSKTITPPRISEVYTRGTLIARAARTRGADRGRQPGGPRPATRLPERSRDPRPVPRPAAEPSGQAADVARDRERLAGSVRADPDPRRSPADAAASLEHYRLGRGRRSPVVPDTERNHLMQTPAPFGYERATSIGGVIASLQQLGPTARVVAGGHSLIPMMKLRLANPEHLIDINDLDELSYIRREVMRSGSGR